jgi:ArsR family transcriptional regulator
MKTPYHRPAQILRALSHPVRLRLLDALCEDEQCVCHLTALVGKRQAYTSQQLAALRNVGLVKMRKEGLRVYYRLSNPNARTIIAALNIARSDNHVTHGCECPKCTKGG